MKKTFKFFAAALAIVAAASCAKEISNDDIQAPEQELVHKVFTASLNVDPETKTTLHTDGVSVHWNKEDVIKVLLVTSASGTDFSVVSCDGAFADFEGETIDASSYRALYPAAALVSEGHINWWYTEPDYYILGSRTSKCALAHQYAVENDFSIVEEFASSSNFALSTSSEDGHLYFKNINAYLKVRLAMDNAASIEVSAAKVMNQSQSLSEYAKLGGPITIDFAHSNKMGILASAGEDITFKKEDGSNLLSGDDIYYYIAIPAVKIEGLKLVVKDANGKVLQTMTKKSTFTAESNKIYNLGVIEAAKVEPAKVGDYFYSDGTYSTELDSSKEVVGVVFLTGNPKELMNDTMLPDEYCHGLAISTTSRQCAWHSTQLSSSSIPSSLKYTITTTIKDFSKGGYTTMQEYAGNSYVVYDNGDAPSNTSGWYLGTPMEWNYILNNRDQINSLLSNVNGDIIDPQGKSTSFWLPLFFNNYPVIVYLDSNDQPYYYYEQWYYIPQNSTYCHYTRPIFAF